MSLPGVLLLTGFVAFACGALLPPSRAFTGTQEEQRRVVRAHPSRWVASAVSLGTGVVVTFAGLTLLAVQLADHGAPSLAILAIVCFGVGAVLFLVELAYRASVFLSVATAGVEVPAWFEPLHAWAGAAYWAYMSLAYPAVALLGGAILQSTVLGAGFGWAAMAFGVLGATVFVSKFPRPLWTLFDIPGLLYLVTGALGVGLLVGA
jgi:hypothetical protein